MDVPSFPAILALTTGVWIVGAAGDPSNPEGAWPIAAAVAIGSIVMLSLVAGAWERIDRFLHAGSRESFADSSPPTRALGIILMAIAANGIIVSLLHIWLGLLSTPAVVLLGLSPVFILPLAAGTDWLLRWTAPGGQ